ncbi:MAG: hypothetical protein H7Z39_04845, partial [Burkholderiaceae bacterium]|nr:hypothetical protein [Burkholderiaceae bacterium]
SAQFKQLYLTLFAREPSKTEAAALKDFLNKQEKVIAQNASSGKFAVAVPTGLKENTNGNPLRAAAFVDLVHTVANSNDFAYRF